MSEIGETPNPQETKDISALHPEIQEQLRDTYERVQTEAADPAAVVSRSIDEMGFFEGLWKTTETYRKEKMNIIWKNFKAKTSLVLSLIPVLGEGKALLGVTREAGKITKFEPARRFALAGMKAQKVFQESVSAAKVAEKSVLLAGTKGVLKGAWEAKGMLGKLGAQEARHSLAALEKSNLLFAKKQAVAKAAELKYKETKVAKLAGSGYEDGVRWGWLNLKGQFKVKQAEWAAKVAMKTEMKTGKAAKAVADFVAKDINPSHWKIHQGLEKKIVHAKSAVDVAIKRNRFMVVVDSMFNLTPDVPLWLALSTAAAEGVGVHGADAISASVQLGANALHEMKVTLQMSKDVLAYTKNRLFGKREVAKQAAEQFIRRPVPVAAT